MATCPACKGTRIRDDYKPAPFALRMVGVRALLCDYCNHQFRAFSPLPPKSRKPRALQRKADVFNEAPNVDLNQLDLPALPVEPALAPDLPEATPPVSKVEIVLGSISTPLVKESLQALARAAADDSLPKFDRLEVSALRRDLKTEITKLYAKNGAQPVATIAQEQTEAPRFTPVCPECGSTEVRRRHRTAIERAALSLTNHKAYSCRSCKASFYAKPDETATASDFADA